MAKILLVSNANKKKKLEVVIRGTLDLDAWLLTTGSQIIGFQRDIMCQNIINVNIIGRELRRRSIENMSNL
jgi:hypothetical protein